MKEIFQATEKSTTVTIINSEIHSVMNKSITSTGLRLYENGCIGIAGAQGSYNEKELEAKARDMLKRKIAYPYAPSANRKQSQHQSLKLPAGFNLLEETQAILNTLKSEYPDFTFSHQSGTEELTVTLKNEMGLDLAHSAANIGVALMFKSADSGNIMDGFFGYGGVEYDRNAFLDAYRNILNAYRVKVELPNQPVMPVVFDGIQHLMGKFYADLNGNQIGTGASLLAKKIGQQLFHPNFSLYQTKHPDDCYDVFFDKEGVVNEGLRYPMIENGKLLCGFTDKKSAAKYNLPHTGAANGTYDSIPSAGATHLHIPPTDKSLKELLNGQLGIYVMVASGGDFNSAGDYGTPVQLAYLTDGEKLLGRLPEVNIKSNLFRMFGDDYIGVSKETTYVHSLDHYLVVNMQVSKIYE